MFCFVLYSLLSIYHKRVVHSHCCFGIAFASLVLIEIVIYCCFVTVVSDSSRPHGLQPTRLLCPWDFPDKNNGVGDHFLLQGDLPDPGIEPLSPALQADSLPLSHQESTQLYMCYLILISWSCLTIFFVQLCFRFEIINAFVFILVNITLVLPTSSYFLVLERK